MFTHHEYRFNDMLADGNLESGGFDAVCCGAEEPAEAGRWLVVEICSRFV